MPFIRRTTSQINKHGPKKDCVAYHGMHLNSEQRSFFTKNKLFRSPGFTSTTKKKEVAKTLGNTLFEIRISARCSQVRDISQFSHFKYEEKMLFSPHSRFQVVTTFNEVIILRAIDNLSKIEMIDSNNDADNDSSDGVKFYWHYYCLIKPKTVPWDYYTPPASEKKQKSWITYKTSALKSHTTIFPKPNKPDTSISFTKSTSIPNKTSTSNNMEKTVSTSVKNNKSSLCTIL
ncbi:unnamed protein product [Rotaria sp. Silwood2]|nr:unnamed protein product [Rotaria sp. Silwood2]CAF3087858.1 unnamed protein product [Rotaria sp. Silwood2]CAF3101062.1 unnamed protein product [Rotaria sp. Silwood2]CAF3255598.1 unnamed protein product [Rotaria sp. Silwood2]CAF4017078.1 unnamed protein product [Rotaria sp. Silwood2]